MLTKKTPALLALFGLILLLQLPASAQTIDQAHRKYVQDLEAHGWIASDTVVTFDPETYKETVQIVTNDARPKTGPDGKLIYQICEKLPEFPGGTAALMEFLAQNLRYPPMAKAERAEQTVVMEFVVNEDGSIGRVYPKTADEIRPDFVEESVRVIRSLPRWIPAEHKGQKVKCTMQLPIRFKLN